MELQRITTEFIDHEDRIRLCGDVGAHQSVVMWLTQRLLDRLVPFLLNWVEQQMGISAGVGADVRAEVVNSFAQQAALASMTHQAPVQAHMAQQAWLVHAVDVTVNQDVLRLTFKGPQASQESDTLVQACVTLQAQPLRQWLSILHEQCLRAGWASASPDHASPRSIWPEWMQDRQTGSSGGVAVLH